MYGMKGLEPTLLTSLSAIGVLHPRGVASLLISAQLPAVQLEPQSWKERDLRSWEESRWAGRYLRDGKEWPETPLECSCTYENRTPQKTAWLLRRE